MFCQKDFLFYFFVLLHSKGERGHINELQTTHYPHFAQKRQW